MRSPAFLLSAVAGAAMLAGCAGGTAPTPTAVPSATVTAPPSAPAVSTPRPTTAPPTTAPATAAAPILTGDAATNPACALATVAEISEQVDAGVREMRGLTSPGAYAENLLSCAWYLDSTDVGIPSVVLQWEFRVTTHHDAVVDLYELIVEQDLATTVDGVGDKAILQGWTAEAIDGENIVRLSVLQHMEPTEKDKQDAIALLRLFLERTAPE